MHLKTLRLDRVFDVVTASSSPEYATGALFSFESCGKRYFGITAHKVLCPREGQTITALLKYHDDWQPHSLQGFIVHETQAISCAEPRYGGVPALFVNGFFAWVSYLMFAFEEPHVLRIAFGAHALFAVVVTLDILKGRKIRRLLRQAYRAESG